MVAGADLDGGRGCTCNPPSFQYNITIITKYKTASPQEVNTIGNSFGLITYRLYSPKELLATLTALGHAHYILISINPVN